MMLFRIILFMAVAAITVSAGSISAAEKPESGKELLLASYHKNASRFETSTLGPPLILESFEQDNRVNVDIYGIFNFQFKSVSEALMQPANWCEIVLLHPNVKACTFEKPADEYLLTFYFGRKTYQAPEGRTQVVSSFRNALHNPGYLDVGLNAEQGPFGTKNHIMRFEALPLEGGRTFVHVNYAYSSSSALHLAAKIYFATLGRGKVGFSVTGNEKNGNLVYVGGTRGALERSAVRYYLAIQSYMNTLRYPEESRFRMRISEWFDLTARYRKQLLDLDRQSYLTSKAKEHKNQAALQHLIGAGIVTSPETKESR